MTLLAWIAERLPKPPSMPPLGDPRIEPPDSPLMQDVETARKNGGIFHPRKPCLHCGKRPYDP